MNEGEREILRAVSFFLQYPRDMTSGPEFSIIQEGEEKRVLMDFWRCRQGKPLLRLQEEYTGTFDLNPSTSLNLTFHNAEPQARGKLLLHLRELYEDAGYENMSSELPDYLPLVLEFLAVCPDRHRRSICREYSVTVALLASRLKEAESPYAGLMDLVKETFSRYAQAE